MRVGLLYIDSTVDKKLLQNHHIPKYTPHTGSITYIYFLPNYFRVSSSKSRFKNKSQVMSQDTAFRQELKGCHLLESNSVRLD